ncbi:TOBE domain-containing protein [Variovorax sp. HJSM1_2]|uniref:TOBE domain-containing protein n=1 Tax=Variovorax sp. HJSM1_2 TaxID=3366263 RepID=UPI003BBEB895
MQEDAPTTPSFANALGQASTDKRIEILRLVAQGGSISEAGRQAGVSYKAAWQAIDTLTNLAGVALVERAVGGAGGGGARITAAGTALLAGAEKLDQARQQVLALLQSPQAGFSSVPVTLLRTSMRNQFPCRVLQLQRQGQMVNVTLQLAGDDWLVARITQASAELLALQPGQGVLALAKATALRVAGLASQAENSLPCRVSRVSRDAAGDEVSVELAGGIQLVGFAASGNGLRARSRAWVSLDASAVVIALPA